MCSEAGEPARPGKLTLVAAPAAWWPLTPGPLTGSGGAEEPPGPVALLKLQLAQLHLPVRAASLRLLPPPAPEAPTFLRLRPRSFLNEVQSCSSSNRTSVQNLAAVFGPDILRAKADEPQSIMGGKRSPAPPTSFPALEPLSGADGELLPRRSVSGPGADAGADPRARVPVWPSRRPRLCPHPAGLQPPPVSASDLRKLRVSSGVSPGQQQVPGGCGHMTCPWPGGLTTLGFFL